MYRSFRGLIWPSFEDPDSSDMWKVRRWWWARKMKVNVPDPWHFGVDALNNGSGSWIRILLFSSLTFKMPTKNYFFYKFFWLLLLEDTFTSFFKEEESKRSNRPVGIKVFLTVSACLEGSGSGSGTPKNIWIRIRIQIRIRNTDWRCLMRINFHQKKLMAVSKVQQYTI